MNIEINGLNINYEVSGEGSAVILLHGWLCSLETMRPIANIMQGYKVYNVDLPGFGKSDMPTKPFNTNDFGDFLDGFVKKLEIENPILIGHSNGGRTILNYAGRKLGKIKKIILLNISTSGNIPKNFFKVLNVYTFM